MASHGKVLDLLDDRYLNLQDVIGNVEPLPTLLPYELYTQNMIVYQMDTKHEIFMGLIQEFTDRTARQLGRELWTWWVQWEVEEPPTEEPVGSPAAKKPRFTLVSEASPRSQAPTRKGPAYTIVERRCLRPDLFEESDMLRILIDIVQVDSRLVPNYVEFLYQWIDFYEGDGKALQAAMRMEIPSLWAFEYHPLPLTSKIPKPTCAYNEEDEADENDTLREAAAKLSRSKPDLAALERMTEESERMQYREVRFGIQPPIDPNDEPLPPLINIPRDMNKRKKYYAACFKNRQRALWLLQEAGMSVRQIASYKRLQDEEPKDTPEVADGNGFMNYYKEEPFAHDQYSMNEKMKQLREKQKEIAISNRLAMEAQLAAVTASTATGSTGQHSVPPPLIPPTPTYPGRPDLAATLMRRIQGMSQKRDPGIPAVPSPLLLKMKSKLFKNSIGSRPFLPSGLRPSSQNSARPNGEDTSESEDEDGYDDDTEGDSDSSGDDEDGSMSILPRSQTTLGAALHPSILQPALRTAPNVATFVQGLSRTQLSSLMPLLNAGARQAVLQRTSAHNAPLSAQGPGQAFGTGAALSTMTGSNTLQMIPAPQTSASPNPGASTVYGNSSRQNPLQNPPPIVVTPSAQNVGAEAQTSSDANISESGGLGSVQPAPLQQFTPAQGLTSSVQSQVQALFSAAAQSTNGVAASPASTLTQSQTRAPPPASLNLQHLQPPSNLPSIRRPSPSTSPSPFTPLATRIGANLSLASPQATSPHGTPIQIYIPKIVLANQQPYDTATDCLILGYTHPTAQTLTLTSAIFLPVGVWENTLNRVRKGHFKVLETYPPPPNHPRFAAWKGGLKCPDDVKGPHKAVYEKLSQVHGFMVKGEEREESVTKRWRATPGLMRERERGAVWEGWGVGVDRAVEMGFEERRGALVFGGGGSGLFGVEVDEDMARRRKEIEELLDEDERDDAERMEE